MKRMIFHMPVPFDPNGKTGSHIRPIEMLNAFKQNGYDVELIAGYGKERKEALKKLKEKIKSGVKYEFLYSELSTMPMFLTEKHHLPLYFYVEILLFKLCKKYSIPVTAFYRDIYWKFDLFQKGTSYYKKIVAFFFYHFELLILSKFASVLFLPSLEMRKAIPYEFKNTDISELPPGIAKNLTEFKKEKTSQGNEIKLLYVGGVLPPLYDLTEAIRQIGNVENVSFTIVCRREEWSSFGSNLKLPKNIFVRHVSGKELELEYSKADLSLIVLGNHPYRRFCMPLKLFEAISFDTPVVMLSSMNAASDLVREHNLGYIINSESELHDVFNRIFTSRDELNKKMENNNIFKKKITWSARADTVNKKATRTKEL